VQLVGEENIFAERLADGQAPLIELLLATLDAAVEAGEEDLNRAVANAGALEQVAEPCAAPAAGADRLVEPRLADRPRREARTAGAGALHGRDDLVRGQRTEVAEAQAQLGADIPVDVHAEGGPVDARDVVVDQEVVEPDRSDRLAQHLERHAVITGRELQLL